MRLVMVMVLAGLMALPLSVSAQPGEQGEASEPDVVEGVPTPEAAPEEPALELKLDDAAVEVVPPPPRTPDGYTLEEMELRVKRANIGLGVSAGVAVAGVVPLVLGYRGDSCNAACPSCTGEPQSCSRMRIVGYTVVAVSGISMIVTGILVGVRKAEIRSLAADYTSGELELRVKRAKIGLGVSGGVFLVGSAMAIAAIVGQPKSGFFEPELPNPPWVAPVGWTAVALVTGGFAGMVTSGVMLRVRKRQPRRGVHDETPRRVQWDLARSRLVS
jgi:hypothetical protein